MPSSARIRIALRPRSTATIGYFVAVVVAAIGVVSMPQAARAQSALVGTRWFANSVCIINMIDFYDHGIAQSETGEDASWTQSGNQLSIKFPDSEKTVGETLIGTLDGPEFQATHSYTFEGAPQSETCSFKRYDQ